jgi:pimeloyl-ACP methyl ester carboxylesterase
MRSERSVRTDCSLPVYARPDGRPPLVLLHGLTFDRAMRQPALAELRKTDPGRQVLALDLPGHGGAADLAGRRGRGGDAYRGVSQPRPFGMKRGS